MAHYKRSPLIAFGASPLLMAGAMVLMATSSAFAATSVTGSAYGFHSFNISIFGGSQNPVGPTPTVTLASDASNSPQNGSATTGLVQYGPATLFTADAITVSTKGTSSSVTSTATVKNANKATTQSSTGSEILTADSLSATCSSSSSGTTGSTSIGNGVLTTDNGTTPPKTVNLPANPAPNTSISGAVHPSTTSTDTFHVVFNEQSTSNGVLTVNAADEYFEGPTLKGNLIIGQAVCGLSGVAASIGGTGSSAGGVSTPASGSGNALVIGVPVAVVGAGVLVGAGVIARRRARARDTRKTD